MDVTRKTLHPGAVLIALGAKRFAGVGNHMRECLRY